MSPQRYEIKVGAFVLLGFILLAVLVLMLSKGTNFWVPTYNLRLVSDNVGGIKAKAPILLSGVPIGRVAQVEIGEEGTNVVVILNILKKYKIYSDAAFDVEQFGFLGDQYVAVKPDQNRGRLLQEGDEVQCTKPFNMQEAVGRAAETISRIGQTATNLNSAVSDVRHFVLNEQTLENLQGALDRISSVAGQALDAVSNVNGLVAANSTAVTAAVSNLNYFTAELSPMAGRVNDLVSTNSPAITAAINNLYATTSSLTNLMNDIQSQKGLAGRVLADPDMAKNFSDLSRNLASISATLDQRGIWGLWRTHKSVYTNTAAASGTK